MKKIFIILLSVFYFSNLVCAQNLKKGFKLLEKLEYEKALSFFSDLRESDNQNPAVNFGLTLVFSDDKSPLFHLVKAWSYCRILQKNIDNLTEEELEIIGEYFMNTEQRHTARPVKKKIEYAIAVVEANLIKYVREENNLELTYEVIEKFPDFRHFGNVIHIRNQLEFRKCEKQNTLEGYLEFIKKFPEAAQIDKALKYCHKLAFEKAQADNTVEAYNRFIQAYPDADEYNLAIKKRNAAAFGQAKAANTLQSYEEYIRKYPGSLEIAEAKILQRQILYEQARKIKTLEAYNEFIKKYPEGQQYIDIFNLKSLDLGMKYLSSSSITSSSIQWVRSFDLGGETEKSGTVEMVSDRQYFMAITTRKNDTSYSDIWLLCLDKEGKMIWNKTTGGKYHDQVLYSAVNQKNEIILAGYTWNSIDSASRQIWLFKQAPDGKNIWSQQLGKWKINTLTVDNNNNILLGGYQLNDSLGKNSHLIVLNDAGRKLWERTYSDTGEIRSLNIMPDQTVLVVTDYWITKMDIKGYIKQEFVSPPGTVYHFGMASQNGDLFLSGVRRDNCVFISSFGADGKKRWEKEHILSDTISAIVKMTAIEPDKALLISKCKQGGNNLLWFQYQNGVALKNVFIGKGTVNDALLDSEKNLILLVEDENAIFLKNAGTIF
ncbi:MAG: tetratricopeptide repeat protein [Bacteroidales bacterium]|nr:tetratricopeptide repeat protein [Bacteroidales bacterium]